jgi:hypothetical protein
MPAKTHSGEEQRGFREVVSAASVSPGLLRLEVEGILFGGLHNGALQRLLTSCAHLTHLDLDLADIDPDGLDILLEYGRSITSLALGSFVDLYDSVAERQCSWKRLHLHAIDTDNTCTLAYLPLKTVEELSIGECTTPVTLLQLPLYNESADNLCQLVRQAAVNLASCPAWQHSWHRSQVGFVSDPDDRTFLDKFFQAEQRVQLLQALAPLGGPHLQGFTYRVSQTTFDFGHAEVQALAQNLGSSVASMHLSSCTLQPCFWPALLQHFPNLTRLELGAGTHFNTRDLLQYLHATATCNPVAVGLHQELYEALQEHVRGGDPCLCQFEKFSISCMSS